MSDDGRDSYMMIGLHKMASQNGDGLVPELYALLSRSLDEVPAHANVVAFPLWDARVPGVALGPAVDGRASDGGNVIAFSAEAGHKRTVKTQR